MDIANLKEKLERVQELLERKEIILAEIETIDTTIASLLSQIQTKTNKPSKSLAHSLNYYIIRAMAPGAHMHLWAIAAKILELGYETTNERFSSYLQVQLKKRNDIVVVRHGVYMRKANIQQKTQTEVKGE